MDKDIEKLLALTKESEKNKQPKEDPEKKVEQIKKIAEKTKSKETQTKKTKKEQKETKTQSTKECKEEVEIKTTHKTHKKTHKRTKRLPGSVNPSDVDVFIKIDDHVSIAKTLLGSKKELKAISDTILLLAKAEKLKREAVERMEKHLEVLKKDANEVYTKMAQYGKYVNYKDNSISQHTLSDIDDLSKELEEIRKELSKI